MWPPKSVNDIEEALNSGLLQERSAVDVKRALPASKQRNVEAAVDVAAMATAGGVLIYGIGEDANRILEKDPIVLAGAKDRLANIVQSSVSEPPQINVIEIPLPADPTKGYLVVDIPASPQAPHMVQVKGQFKYYGRNEAGNYPLPHQQVVALIEQRRRWQLDWEEALNEAIHLTAKYGQLADFVPLDVVFLPLLSDPDTFSRAFPAPDQERGLISETKEVVRQLPFAHHVGMNIAQVGARGLIRVVDGWLARAERFNDRSAHLVSELEVGDSGRVRFFWGGIGQIRRSELLDEPAFLVYDAALAQLVAQTTKLAGDIYKRAGYRGPVLAAISIRNTSGVISWNRTQAMLGATLPYGRDQYRLGRQFPAEILAENPREVSLELAGPWLKALSQMDPAPLLRFRND